MNKCKITIGKCSICDHVRESDQDRVCPLEIYSHADISGIPYEYSVIEKILMVVIAIAGVFGLAKAFGVY